MSGARCQCSAQPPAKKTAGQIFKETLKKRILRRRINIEYRTRNNEYRSNVFYHFRFEERLSTAIPHFIIRNFLFDILRFAVKLMKFHTRCQDLAPRFPDTRNLTPKIYKLRHCCPAGASFYERSIGKSIAF